MLDHKNARGAAVFAFNFLEVLKVGGSFLCGCHD